MDRASLWVLRGLWLALPVVVVPAVARATDGAGWAVGIVAAAGLWGLWAAGLVATLVPCTVSLTVMRLLAPAPLAVGVIAMVAEPGWWPALEVVVGVVLLVVAFRASVGRIFVQGSAYGDEARFPLRAPGPLVLGPLPLLWLALAGSLAGAPLLLAAQHWLAGGLVALAAIGLALVLPQRFHQLSRRFLAFVPAGLVVHDHVVLAETAMFRWSAVRSFTQALAGTEALDLTGGALGPAVEVALADMATMVRVGLRPGRTSAVHARAFLCSPTLVQAAVAEADRRRPEVR